MTLPDIRRWEAMIEALPEPIAYIVLDPNWSPSLPLVDGHDSDGRRYVLCSPAVLDEFQHVKAGDVLTSELVPRGLLTAITILRRDELPEDWPDA